MFHRERFKGYRCETGTRRVPRVSSERKLVRKNANFFFNFLCKISHLFAQMNFAKRSKNDARFRETD